MDDKVIQRIDGVLKLINKIRPELDGVSFEEFLDDEYLVDAISFRLSQIGEKMIKLEKLLGEKYPNIPWKSARKMRNIIVHDYENTNPFIIYDTATNDLETLKNDFLKIRDDIKHISDNSLTTERLLIRPWDDLDAPELFELAKSQEIARWCGWKPHKDIRDTLFVLHNFLEVRETYAICLRESGSVIGSISLMFDSDLIKSDSECELGFWIGEKYQGNGYAFQATKEVIRHAFSDLKMTKIWCGYYDGNDKSKKLQEKLGFAFCFSDEKPADLNTGAKCIRHINLLEKEKWEALK